MKGKTLQVFWTLSLVALIAVTVALEAAKANSITLPDQAVRLLGILNIASLTILIFTSLKMFLKNRREK